MKKEIDNKIRNIEEFYKTAKLEIQNENYSNGLISILKAQEILNTQKKNNSLRKYFVLQADIFFIKGYLYHNHFSLSSQALANFLASMKIYEKKNLKKQLVECYFGIGNLYKKQQKFDKAIEFYLKIIEFDRNFVSGTILNEIFEKTAEIYFNKEKYETAFSYYIKALQLATKTV